MENLQVSEKRHTTRNVILGIVAVLIIISIYNNGKSKESRQSVSSTNAPTVHVKLGEVFKSEYFDIIVNSMRLANKVDTGNQFSDLKPEDGSKYLIMNVTFKNTSDTDRIIFDGTLYIESGTKEYSIGNSETILADGWGLFLTKLNPLLSKKTNLVYKVSGDMHGIVLWKPTGSNDSIEIGKI